MQPIFGCLPNTLAGILAVYITCDLSKWQVMMPSPTASATSVTPSRHLTSLHNAAPFMILGFIGPPVILADTTMPAATGSATIRLVSALGSVSAGIAAGAVSAILAELVFPPSVADGTRTGHEARLQRQILEAVKNNRVQNNLPAQQLQQSLAMVVDAYPSQSLKLFQGETTDGQIVLAYLHENTVIPLMRGGQVVLDPLKYAQNFPATRPELFHQPPTAWVRKPVMLRPSDPRRTQPPQTPPPVSRSSNLGALAIILSGLRGQISNPSTLPKTLDINGQCGMRETAESYLTNLGRDGLDQAARSIPPQTWEWGIPGGYHIKVKQLTSKYGLTYDIQIAGPDNKRWAFNEKIKFEATREGVKIPISTIPLSLNGTSEGYADLSLRVDGTGLNELEIKYTDPLGQIKILKLKPSLCNLDLTGSHLLRMNAGNSFDARYWTEAHLAQSAQVQRGQLTPGLLDLLRHIQPAASGQYLNHGSTALAALTRPLNLLKAAGVDFSPMSRLKNRVEAKNWLYSELQNAVRQGKIQPKDLVNPYRINYGIPALAALMPEPVSRTNAATNARNTAVPVAWVGAKTPEGKSLQAPIMRTNDGKVYYLRGKDTSYALPAKNLSQASEAARNLIRSGQANNLAALSHPTRHLRWVGAITPDGISVQGQLVFWRSESGQIQYGLKGTNNRLYPLLNAEGQAPKNSPEALQRAQDLIRHGAATHLHGLPDAQSVRQRRQSIQLLHTKVDIRRVKELVHQQGWLVTQLPNGKLFLTPTKSNKAGTPPALPPALQEALAQVFMVPVKRLHHGRQTLRLLGTDRDGLVVEARGGNLRGAKLQP
jgi:hypothetical protein